MPLDAADVVFNFIIDSTSTTILSAFPFAITRENLHKVTIDREQFRVVLDLTPHLMNMKLAEILSKLSLPFRSNISKILVTKDDNTPLSGQKCQLIFLLRGQ